MTEQEKWAEFERITGISVQNHPYTQWSDCVLVSGSTLKPSQRDRILQLAAERDALNAEVHAFKNLAAVMFRDGGQHYYELNCPEEAGEELEAIYHALRAQVEAGKALLGNEQAWPLRECFFLLADFTARMLKERNCDIHGYENLRQAVMSGLDLWSAYDAAVGKEE